MPLMDFHIAIQKSPNPEKTIMQDRLPEILKKFVEYAQTFNLLEPTNVAPFFHLPSMLMTSEQVAVMNSSEQVIAVFTVMMDELRAKDFKESKIIGNLQVTQLNDNQGQVVGVAKRFNDRDEVIEHFGFTYILRKIQIEDKVEAEWKIIAGVLHEPETLSK
jgi:hypothetical protein